MIFSLSTCGAASLRLHGPAGLAPFLTAIQSFVRRKYPRITCVETHDGSASSQPRDAPNNHAAFDYETWQAITDQSDQHMRIFAVTLRARSSIGSASAQSLASSCLLCEHNDTVPVATVHTDTTSSQLPVATRDPTDAPFRAWLVRFYTAKVPEKLPYVDVILSRYRGRLDDLKAQLCAKYGALNSDDASNSSSSSDSDSDDSDSEASSSTTDFGVLPFSREWLVRFYRQHQPEKLLHVDRVLKQFSGREDALKSMLLLKYAPSAAAEEKAEPASKRQKLESSTPPSPAVAVAVAVAGDSTAASAQEELPAVFIEPHTGDRATPASAASTPPLPSSLCYVMKYVAERPHTPPLPVD